MGSCVISVVLKESCVHNSYIFISQVKIGLATGTCNHVSWYYLFYVV